MAISMQVSAQATPATPDMKVVNDTTVQVTMNINEFRAVLYAISSAIDSKKATSEIVDFLQRKARMLEPADKPKATEAPKPATKKELPKQ